jgi:hypothetical protein
MNEGRKEDRRNEGKKEGRKEGRKEGKKTCKHCDLQTTVTDRQDKKYCHLQTNSGHIHRACPDWFVFHVHTETLHSGHKFHTKGKGNTYGTHLRYATQHQVPTAKFGFDYSRAWNRKDK